MEEKTFREKVHTVLCINGGISEKAVRMMSGSQSYKLKVMCEMRQQEMVEKKQHITRLTRKGLNEGMWNDEMPEMYLRRREENRDRCMKATEGRLRRYMYQSEVLTAMLESGAEIYEGDMDELPNRIVYVRSKKVKADGEMDKQAIKRSRAMGTLYGAEGNLYNVYAMGSGVLTWSHNSEAMYKACVERKNQERTKGKSRADAILLVDDIGNLKRFTGKRMRKGGPMRAGDVYQRMYVLPKDQMGTQLLNVLLIPESETATEEIAAEHKAFNFLLPNVAKLRAYGLTEAEEGSVCCIKGYEDGVKGVVPGVDIEAVDIEELIERTLSKCYLD